jgi:hypothetical protein
MVTEAPVTPVEIEHVSTRAPAFIAIWPRGFAKSTLAELACVYLGARGSVPNSKQHKELEADWKLWLYTLFPEHLSDGAGPIPMAPYHEEFFEWISNLRTPRLYTIYTSDTQEQAEQHVENIAAHLMNGVFSKWYPRMAARKVTKFGHSAGWRRTRLRTASGFVVDAAGLDRGIRGAKVERMRPDLIVFDDLDRDTDTPTTTDRKIRNLTRSIIPTQGPDCAFIGAQNLILRGGIFDRLQDGTADFLAQRVISGPHPALSDFTPAQDLQGRPDGGWDIVGGTPTWASRGLAHCQFLLDTFGREAFLIECQHMLSEVSDLVFPNFNPDTHEWKHAKLPEFVGYYGGWDFGGEGLTAHRSALSLIGRTDGGRYILLDEWSDNGPDVWERQLQTAQEWQDIYGSIRWCQDGDERTVFQHLRGGDIQLNIQMSRRGPGSVETRVRTMGRLLERDGSGRPGFYYLRKANRFRSEMQAWRRRPPRSPNEPAKRDILSVNDDVLVSVLYALERAEREQIGVGQQMEVVIA